MEKSLPIRIIPRLDVKNNNVIKSVNLEGLRLVGKPSELAYKYYIQGADELLYVDVVASLYGRNNLKDVVYEATKNIFIPFTVVGGIRSLSDFKSLLLAGADKVGLNTAAIQNPDLITELANQFGSQSVILSIEAKKIKENYWEAMTHNGREKTGKNVIEWAKESIKKGVGEILITSIDKEGTKKGFDIELMKEINEAVNVPVIASGGMGCIEHALELLQFSSVSGFSIADILHYNRSTIDEIRDQLIDNKYNVRKIYEK